jgi:hypothetical protein
MNDPPTRASRRRRGRAGLLIGSALAVILAMASVVLPPARMPR